MRGLILAALLVLVPLGARAQKIVGPIDHREVPNTALIGGSSNGALAGVTLGANLSLATGVLSAAGTAPGGSTGQLQWNNAGVLGGLTVGGDATLNTATGALTVTGTNGVAFGSLATLNAAPAGTLTGSTLASGITGSSLTSLAGGTVGTAAYLNTGTSGGTLPLLNGVNTWSGAQTFSGGLSGTLTGHASLDLATGGGTMTGGIAMGANALTGASSYGVAASGDPYYLDGGSTIKLSWNGSAIAANAGINALNYATGNNLQAVTAGVSPLLNIIGHYSGTVGASAADALNELSASSDTMACGAGADNVCKMLDLEWNFTGTGSRTGLWSRLVPGALSSEGDYTALTGSITMANNAAGSFLQPLATTVNILSSATNVGSTLNEFDYSAEASVVGVKGALQITLSSGDTSSGISADAGLFFSNANLAGISPGMGSVIALGNTDQGWPINPTTGKVLGVLLQANNGGNSKNGQFISPAGFAGIDLQYENVSAASGYSFRGQGFAVDGAGQGWFANGLEIGVNSGVYQVNVPNTKRVGSVAIATPATPNVSAGVSNSSYYPGDIVYDAATPAVGQYKITATQAAGASYVAVNNGGTGGTTGACTVTGTTGTGTKFQIAGTVTGGVFGGTLSVSAAGVYTVNPTNLAAEPVTGCGLTGATLSIGMGAEAVSVLQAAVYASCPGSIVPVGGSGAGLVLTPTCATDGSLEIQASGGAVQIGSGAFTANGSTSLSLTNIGPSGAHATVQEWLTITDASGVVRYIPTF